VQPLIDPGFYTNTADIIHMREGIKNAIAFVAAPAWKDYILDITGSLTNGTTDADIDQYVLDNSGTNFHLCGTAAMTSSKARYGVVNPDLRVKGVNGLRVVDASVFVSALLFALT